MSGHLCAAYSEKAWPRAVLGPRHGQGPEREQICLPISSNRTCTEHLNNIQNIHHFISCQSLCLSERRMNKHSRQLTGRQGILELAGQCYASERHFLVWWCHVRCPSWRLEVPSRCLSENFGDRPHTMANIFRICHLHGLMSQETRCKCNENTKR